MKREHKQFYNDVLTSLDSSSLAVFAGAGLSKAAGYVDWKELLRDIADDLGLSVDIETDLISVAQYNVNKVGGRSMLNQKILNEFLSEAEATPNHQILARLPIYTYWTTNYDDLIEKSIREAKRFPDVKHTVSQLSSSRLKRDAIVYKMHGDAENPNEAVLTKDDYENYFRDNAAFITALSGDMVSKLFVFVGFSFTDPNLDYVLSRVRLNMRGSGRHHYFFVKKVSLNDSDIKDQADFEYKQQKQKHFIDDLKRFQLIPVYVDTYDEITSILQEIEALYSKRTVFIGGSAEEYGSYDRHAATSFIHRLSAALVRAPYRIVNGFGWGVGSAVINGALEAIHTRPDKYGEEQLIVKPFPQFQTGNKTLPEMWHEYRVGLLSYAGIALFVFGNKKNDKGEIVPADGLEKEFNIARDQGAFLLPVPATGYMSEQLFNRLLGEKYYEGYPGLQEQITKLTTETDPDKLIAIILAIVKLINENKQQITNS